LLNNLQTILDYFYEKNHHIINTGDFNINFLKNDCKKKNLEVLLNVWFAGRNKCADWDNKESKICYRSNNFKYRVMGVQNR